MVPPEKWLSGWSTGEGKEGVEYLLPLPVVFGVSEKQTDVRSV
jgi:hypothetical protein